MPAPKGEFSWIFFVPTIVLLGFALFFLIKNIRVMMTFTRTTGTIIRFDSDKTQAGQSVYRTIVRYQTPDGIAHEARSLTSSSSISRKEGDAVTVYYDPAHLDQAHVHTFRDSWLHILLLGGIGGILFIIWFGILMGTPPANAPANYVRPADEDV